MATVVANVSTSQDTGGQAGVKVTTLGEARVHTTFPSSSPVRCLLLLLYSSLSSVLSLLCLSSPPNLSLHLSLTMLFLHA